MYHELSNIIIDKNNDRFIKRFHELIERFDFHFNFTDCFVFELLFAIFKK